MIESGHVPGKGRIRASILKLFPRVPKNARISVSTGKWQSPGDYRKMVESERLPGKCGIRASTEKLSGRVQKNARISVIIGKWQNPGEYREKVESVVYQKTVPASTRKGSNLCEYRKMVESGRVPGKGRIRTSIEKLSPRLPKKGPICVSTE